MTDMATFSLLGYEAIMYQKYLFFLIFSKIGKQYFPTIGVHIHKNFINMHIM